MKTLTSPAAALIAVALCALPAAAQTPKKVADSNTITITITVAHREASVPVSYLVDGQPVGFAVDLTAAIVEDLRRVLQRPALTTRSVLVSGVTRIPVLVDGSIDLECGSTTHTAARRSRTSSPGTAVGESPSPRLG
jgi:glutamate/aspartate transport system substrate-binding protein